HPALVPIHYAGFKHFVVVRDVYNDHVFVADPALGNISFTRTRFEEIWDQNVLFVIFPSGQEPRNALALNDRDM
ncbi:cysteine peptidase family C39 domain-containing protein, partial [Klebsiella pneumoniae]